MNPDLYKKLVTVVRLLLGAEFTINGLNWWFKMITPYPSVTDDVARFPPGDFVAAMINTGILFHLVKALELAAGIALLANCLVPLALVIAMPVTVNVFIVDMFLSNRLRAHIMGSGALLLNAFLLLAYLDRFRSMLVWRSMPDPLHAGRSRTSPPAERLLEITRSVLAGVALPIGVVMVSWVAVMICQHFGLIN